MAGKKYITPRSTFFRYLYDHKKIGFSPKIWRIGDGCLPTVSANNIVALTTTPSSGWVTSSLDIRKLLEKEALAHAIERNIYVPLLLTPTVSDTGVLNYKALDGVISNATIVKMIQQKTDNRHTAEISLMLTVAFVFAVASTHLFEGERTGIYHSIKKKILA